MYLNHDLHKAVKQHIALTKELDTADPRKFDMSTLLCGNLAYLRLLDLQTGNVPPPHCIIQDCNNVLNHILIVYKCNGTVVQGLGNNAGKRQPGAVNDDAVIDNEIVTQVIKKKIAAKKNTLL